MLIMLTEAAYTSDKDELLSQANRKTEPYGLIKARAGVLLHFRIANRTLAENTVWRPTSKRPPALW